MARHRRHSNIYELLGVEPTATREEIRRAFRQRAREMHPDMRPNDPHAHQEFTYLKEAHDLALSRVSDEPDLPPSFRVQSDDDMAQQARARKHWAETLANEAASGGRSSEQQAADRVSTLRTPRRLAALASQPLPAMVAAALAGNPFLPASCLEQVRQTSRHWMVDAAIASRADCPFVLLNRIAHVQARERLVDLALAANPITPDDVLLQILDNRIDTDALHRIANRAIFSSPLRDRLLKTGDPYVLTRLLMAGDLTDAQVQTLGQNGPFTGDTRMALANIYRQRGWLIPSNLAQTLSPLEHTLLEQQGARFMPSPVRTHPVPLPPPLNSQHPDLSPHHPLVQIYLQAIDQRAPHPPPRQPEAKARLGLTQLPPLSPYVESALLADYGLGKITRDLLCDAWRDMAMRTPAPSLARALLAQHGSWRYSVGMALLRALEDAGGAQREAALGQMVTLSHGDIPGQRLALIDAAAAWPRRSWSLLVGLADDPHPTVRARAREQITQIEPIAVCLVQGMRALTRPAGSAAMPLRGAVEATLSAQIGPDRALCGHMLHQLCAMGSAQLRTDIEHVLAMPRYATLRPLVYPATMVEVS